ncbi:MAG: hypothetical protein ACP5K1_06440, partial [Candidatus Bathyarchaeia archaeon]
MRFKGGFIVSALSVLAFSWLAQTTPTSPMPEELPDLIVEDISLQVMIRNVGDAPIKKMFRLELYVGKKKDPVRWTFTFSPRRPLPPGDGWIGIFDIDKEMRAFYGWALSEGDHKLRAVVDPDQ